MQSDGISRGLHRLNYNTIVFFKGLSKQTPISVCIFYSNLSEKFAEINKNKSRIRETKNLLTDADIRTDKVLERLIDLSSKKREKYKF